MWFSQALKSYLAMCTKLLKKTNKSKHKTKAPQGGKKEKKRKNNFDRDLLKLS